MQLIRFIFLFIVSSLICNKAYSQTTNSWRPLANGECVQIDFQIIQELLPLPDQTNIAELARATANTGAQTLKNMGVKLEEVELARENIYKGYYKKFKEGEKNVYDGQIVLSRLGLKIRPSSKKLEKGGSVYVYNATSKNLVKYVPKDRYLYLSQDSFYPCFEKNWVDGVFIASVLGVDFIFETSNDNEGRALPSKIYKYETNKYENGAPKSIIKSGILEDYIDDVYFAPVANYDGIFLPEKIIRKCGSKKGVETISTYSFNTVKKIGLVSDDFFEVNDLPIVTVIDYRFSPEIQYFTKGSLLSDQKVIELQSDSKLLYNHNKLILKLSN
jgi:hypothetical protein